MSRQQVVNSGQQSSKPPPLPPHPHEQSREPAHSSTTSTSQPPAPPPPPKQQLGAVVDGVPNPSPLGRYDAPPPLPDAAGPASSQSPPSAPFRSTHGVAQNPASHFMPQRNPSLRQAMTPAHFQHQQTLAQPMPSQNASSGQVLAPPTAISSRFAPPPTSPSQARLPYRQDSITQSIPHSISQEPHRFQAVASKNPLPVPQDLSVNSHYQQKSSHPRPTPQPKPPPMNLLDSPFDINLPVSTSANIPAPPIPPNPEKDALLSALSQTITQTLHDDMSQNAASLPLLRSQNEALNNSLHTLESELAQLQVIQSTLTGNVSILQNSLRDADKCISSAHARAQRGEIPKIDDMLTAPTVVGKQLYDVVCDERGIEAAIWALQAALTRGRITMDVWAKKTRELSREGFKRKVLSRKIGKGMGLEE
jgi:ESCRT-I complex subunit TSG101